MRYCNYTRSETQVKDMNYVIVENQNRYCGCMLVLMVDGEKE